LRKPLEISQLLGKTMRPELGSNDFLSDGKMWMKKEIEERQKLK